MTPDNNLSPKYRLRHFSEKAVAAAVWAGAAEVPNSVTKRHHRPSGGVRDPPLCTFAGVPGPAY